ncbi:hypothetical protein KSD_86600 [Ktedonobacter sp. SOSP1-85]|uniref:glycoside hydrolase family 172 protein n=1 Tax=Ktedonobacter sp. SOSP1-85 TaxID=2778367 RepID=UPI00191683CA|nr:glycoside hydrolase family 172 protein [Ktedonobacter sp. SOSP1-85]GHO80889.1 hypothetical protein KSD_86600 [Ktedonobacter sp. SOSP1-85]
MTDHIQFNGLGMGLGNLSRLSKAKTRSISAENFTGEKGKGGMATEGTGAASARDLGQGWKVSPSIAIPPRSSVTLAEIEGPGAIQHMWMTTFPGNWRSLVLRAYWDGEENPSIETPYGDFFASGWCEPCQINSLPLAVNSSGGMNSYWEMPFRASARITLENLSEREVVLYYQITYTLTEVPEDAAYFHAQWRRSNPLPYKEVHTLLDNVRGMGHYVGTYIAWQSNNAGWWGEGEMKFYLDGDKDFPTICGTGTEDYFGGAWCFLRPRNDYVVFDGETLGRSFLESKVDARSTEYGTYSTPFQGLPQVIQPDGVYRSQQRFGMYRWHIMDPIRFEEDLRVTIQGLSWRRGGRYLPLQDDIASVAYWYQTEPHVPHPTLPESDALEVI